MLSWNKEPNIELYLKHNNDRFSPLKAVGEVDVAYVYCLSKGVEYDVPKNSDLYGSANDPRTANDPGPQMIPKLDRKWSRTGNDPHIGLQMIPIKK